MPFDRKAYNAAIIALKLAENDHKCLRSLYMKEMRGLGVELRNRLCQPDNLITQWVNVGFIKHPNNPLNYGVDVSFKGNSPECISAIVIYMEENGWTDVRPVVIDLAYSQIQAY